MIYTIKRHANANSSRKEIILNLGLLRFSILKKNSIKSELNIYMDIVIPTIGYFNLRLKYASCKMGFSIYFRRC
ncbi:hypothetical protein LCGC14_1236000 [marine sediment metagenome]|uniref:Uncharacterized protein n=1 Tax=marine sediment metagenome TaxID=412755 RepID=A0A0F9NPB0_9ZZZZ